MDDRIIAERENRGKVIRSGSFRCAYDMELVSLIITALLALAFLGAVIMFIGDDEFDFFYVVSSACEFASDFAIAMILYGKGYRYEAAEDAFIVTRRGEKQYFYYSEIVDIKYEEFRLFRKKRGYIVTIVTDIKTVTYRFIFGENRIFTEACDTPFYYLMQNVGLAEPDGMIVPTQVERL